MSPLLFVAEKEPRKYRSRAKRKRICVTDLDPTIDLTAASSRTYGALR
jgi:hypothetical protein